MKSNKVYLLNLWIETDYEDQEHLVTVYTSEAEARAQIALIPEIIGNSHYLPDFFRVENEPFTVHVIWAIQEHDVNAPLLAKYRRVAGGDVTRLRPGTAWVTDTRWTFG